MQLHYICVAYILFWIICRKIALVGWNKLTKYFKGTNCHERTLANSRILVKFAKVYSCKTTQFSIHKSLFPFSKKIKTFPSFLLCRIMGKPWRSDMFLKVNVLHYIQKINKTTIIFNCVSAFFWKTKSTRIHSLNFVSAKNSEGAKHTS